jgi:hypothetical protein
MIMNLKPMLALLLLGSCQCSPPIAEGEGDGVEGEGDGVEGEGDGVEGEGDGVEGEGDGVEGEGDGMEGEGDPLEDPYQVFCSGSGTVVGVDTGADACLGDIAQQIFGFGFCACDALSADGSQLLVDSFDSARGGYGVVDAMGTNIGADGHVGVNGAANIDVQLEVHGSVLIGGGGLSLPNGGNNAIAGDLYVFGDAFAGGTTPVGDDAFINGDFAGFEVGGDLQVAPAAVVTSSVAGTITEVSIPPVAPCACGANELLDIAGIVAFGRTNNDNTVLDDPATPANDSLDASAYADPAVSGPSTLTLPCGRFYVAGINQAQSITIHATGRTVLFVDGPFIANGLTIQLDAGAEVDIFVTGDMSFDASSNLGNITTPSGVRSYVNGQLSLGAQATFGGLIYAPHADVVFNAAADIYGALFVNSAEFSGNTEIHFDSAVRRAGDACEDEVGEGEGEPACLTCDSDNSCGRNACVDGTCVACVTDLDCCLPLSCEEGVCTINVVE